MITNNYEIKDGNLIISKDELIRLRNKFYKDSFFYSHDKNMIISKVFQDLIDLINPEIFKNQ